MLYGENMYIDAWINDDEKLVVVERKDGKRIVKEVEPEYTFYVKDSNGSFDSIFGDKLKKHSFAKRYHMMAAKKKHLASDIFESDVNHVYKYFSENYDTEDIPVLHTAYYDIEVGYNDINKYSNQDKTENPVISITVHLDWCDKTVIMALCPNTMTTEEAYVIADRVQNKTLSVRMNSDSDEELKFNTICHIVPDEKTMFDMFFSLCDDADIFTGWNTDGYDNKYLINRAVKLYGEEYMNKFCLFNTPVRRREFIDPKFKTEDYNYEFYGRISLDYLKLYKKYNYSEKSSYKLDIIAEDELGDKKIAYDFSLDYLYRQDFEKFLEYNAKDTLLVKMLEEKLKFIYVTNLVAHNNSVRLIDPLGTVAMTEQAILNEAHSKGQYCPDKIKVQYATEEEAEEAEALETGAAGAFVVEPRKGLRKYISGNDINSLYPSVIRALNMSPETLVAQIVPNETDDLITMRLNMPTVKTFAEAWQPLFATVEYDYVQALDKDKELVVEFRDGTTIDITADKIHEMIYSSDKFCITANGTVFSREKKGIIPSLLERWYAERKVMQAEKDKYKKLRDNPDVSKEEKAEYDYQYGYWDSRQQAKKINLNALYGALLNKYCRFYDKRIGQSTTLTGRRITRHMGAVINQLVTGEYKHDGLATCYGDTDSIYYSVYETDPEAFKKLEAEGKWDKEIALTVHDEISNKVNDTFPSFMNEAFNTGLENGGIIRAGRENMADNALFIKKKRYAMNLYEDDGVRKDRNGATGYLKIMGLEIKRSDTAKIVQDILETGLKMLMTGSTEQGVLEFFFTEKERLMSKEPWRLGSPKSGNAIQYYTEQEELFSQGLVLKPRTPGHIRACMAWNNAIDIFGDDQSTTMTNGTKVTVCPLHHNQYGYKDIAYPSDLEHIPKWLTKLPYDKPLMIEKNFLKKIRNIFGILDWPLHALGSTRTVFDAEIYPERYCDDDFW